MPDTVTKRPALPSWLDPAQQSVISPWWQNAVRTLAGLAGVNDPASQVMTAVAPMAAIAPEAKTLGELAGIKAYHGSPHDFERFDLSKIGTGEGAQAYGHGLYFAENPQTAQAYRDALSGQAYQTSEGLVRHGDMYNRLVQAVQEQGLHPDYGRQVATNVLDGIAEHGSTAKLKEAVEFPQHGVAGQAYRAALDAAEGAKVEKNPGRTYEVAIKAHPDEFLDWDKPLSQQSEHVQSVLRGIFTDNFAKSDPTGAEMYQGLSQDARDLGIIKGHTAQTTLPGAQSKASSDLRDLGIKGIRYLDQGSRTSGHGTYNYVVNDDAIIDIMRKFGVAPPIAATILKQQQAQQKGETVR